MSESSTSSGTRLAQGIGCIFIAGIAVVFLVGYFGSRPEARPAPVVAVSEPSTPAPAPIDVEAIMRASVDPALGALREKNDAAISRVLGTVHGYFGQAKSGAQRFALSIVEERFKILWLSGRDAVTNWWREDQSSTELQTYVERSFSSNVTTGEGVRVAATSCVEQFAVDIRANRNEAIQSIRLNLSTGPDANRVQIDDQIVSNLTRRELSDLFQEIGLSGISLASIVRDVVLIVIENAIQPVLVATMSRIVGGAEVAAAGVASFVPGLGEVVAFLVVSMSSIAVSDYVDNRSEDRIVGLVSGALDSIEQRIVNGSPEHDGLEQILRRVSETQSSEMRAEILTHLQGAAAQ